MLIFRYSRGLKAVQLREGTVCGVAQENSDMFPNGDITWKRLLV